jgi:two-component system sensor histidine kinase CreC
MSTTARLLLGILVVITGAFYFLMDKLVDRVERQYLEAAEEPMVDMAHLLAGLLEQDRAGGELNFERLRRTFDDLHRRQIEARIYRVVKTSIDLDAYVTDVTGRVLFDSRYGMAEGEDYSRYHDVSRTLRGGYGARSTRTDEADDRTSVMHVAAPIRYRGEIVGVVSVAKPQASMFGFIADTRRWIWLLGWSIFAVSLFAIFLVASWFLRPIRQLIDYARAVHRGERVALPRIAGPDMRTLGQALEEMRDSLENRKYVESYVQTLTHEMKSPVAAIRGAVELLQEAGMPPPKRGLFLENIRSEADRLQQTIDRLLALAAIESKKSLEKPIPIRLTQLLDVVCEQHVTAARARDIRLLKDCRADPVVFGEAFLLETALGNLLQNAIDFSPNGGTITVRLIETPNRAVEIRVEDDGPGVPAYALDRVFDRFYSLPHPATGRKSSGLGLCFVREAAQLHGGHASLANRTDRTGATATLFLPLRCGAFECSNKTRPWTASDTPCCPGC